MTHLFTPLLASHGSGFGLNTNLFETNIINLAIVIAGLVYFLRGFLGGILERRRTAILADLKDAEERLASATTAVAVAQKELTDAQAKAERIRVDGESRAVFAFVFAVQLNGPDLFFSFISLASDKK